MIEYSPREPHKRKWQNLEHGLSVWCEVNDMGVIEITEEALDRILRLAGYIEEVPRG